MRSSHREPIPRTRLGLSSMQSSVACAAFVGGGRSRSRLAFQAGSFCLAASCDLTAQQSKRNLTESASPLPSFINTSPQHGWASTPHYLLDVRRLAICTSLELSLQPAWTSPKVVRQLGQSPAKRLTRTKRGSAPCSNSHSAVRATSSIPFHVFPVALASLLL